MADKVVPNNIEEGRKWSELEMRTYAIERDVSLSGITWTDSPPSRTFIVEVTSGAGEHTISISYDTLEKCATDAQTQYQLRERLRGLIGDLARIEKRGHLR
ncbi:MAG: hypothetical protein U0Z53_15435 [Blastocatellia bacterium]